MTQSTGKIQQSAWQEQLNGYWLLSLQVVTDLSTDKSIEDIISADFRIMPNERQIHLFSAQSLNENQWQLQFLSDSQWELPKKAVLQINWRNRALAVNADKLLLLGENLQMAPLFAIAKYRQTQNKSDSDLVLLHATKQFPFAIKPARFMVEATPAEAIGACTLLEDWKVANRLCSQEFIGGCAQMTLAEMFAEWLQTIEWISQQTADEVQSWQLLLSATHDSAEQITALVEQASQVNNLLRIHISILE